MCTATPLLLVATMLPAAGAAALSDDGAPIEQTGDIQHRANVNNNGGSDYLMPLGNNVAVRLTAFRAERAEGPERSVVGVSPAL